MKIQRLLWTVLLLCGLAACDTAPTDVLHPEQVLSAARTAQAERLLVEFNGSSERVTAAVEAAGGRIGRVHEAIGVLEVYDLDTDLVAGMPGVTYATPDPAAHMIQSYPIEYPIDYPGMTVVAYELDPASQPSSDPAAAHFYDCQWNLAQIRADAAWTAARGAGVKIAVLDTGLDPEHIDLAGKVDLDQSTSMLTYKGEGCPAEDRTAITDYNMHGTGVSGIITTNNIGTAGVAPDAMLVMVKVVACDGWGVLGDFLAGLMYVAELEDVEVISMSILDIAERGVPGSNRHIAMAQKAVNYATRKGKLLIGTAGNWSMDLQKLGDWLLIPSSLANVRTAYATDINDQLAPYSDYGISDTWVGAPSGDYPDFAGPPLPGCPAVTAVQARVPTLCTGHSVLWPLNEVCGGKTSAYLYYGAGTSAATPVVAGVAALIESAYYGRLNPHQVAAILAQTADDLGDPGVDNLYSHGRVNAARAVQR